MFPSPLGNTTRFEYTHREKWRSITDPNGNRTEDVRDARHRIAEIHRFGGVHRRYLHDAHDAVVEEQDGGGHTLVKYATGPTGLHTSAVLASREQYSWEYDSRGQFTLASSSQHKVVQRHVGSKLVLDKRDGKGVEHHFGASYRLARTSIFDRFLIKCEYLSTHQQLIKTPDGSTHTLWNTDTQTIRENGSGTSEALTFDSEGRLIARACWTKERGEYGGRIQGYPAGAS